MAYPIGVPVSGAFHVNTTPLPTTLARTTLGALGRTPGTVTLMLRVVV
jgi:hypothetical protein